MHDSVMAFGREYIKPEDVEGKRVLEVGSLDINGSLRGYVESLKPRRYIGTDMRDGPGVDMVIDAVELGKVCDYPFDLVICTEMLEHASDWRAVIDSLKSVVNPGGKLLLTTRSKGFPYHEYPGDFWRFEISDMQQIFADFHDLTVIPDPEQAGVFVAARKPLEGWEEPSDLSEVAVYSMERAARVG